MATKDKPLIAMYAPVSIEAAEPEEGKQEGPAKFSTTFYTGGELEIEGWDHPVVVDLAGLEEGNVLVANLDHDRSKRVGNFDVVNDGAQLVANGTATAATSARDEVVNSAKAGYKWQSSLEVKPKKVEFVKAGASAEVNGQTFKGPVYVARKGVLKGFGFVSHGADDNTTVAIAASAASNGGKEMKPEVKEWIEAMGLNTDELSADVLSNLEADYAGRPGKRTVKAESKSLDDIHAAKKAEQDRVQAITDYASTAFDRCPFESDQIKLLAQTAIDEKWDVDKFRLELFEATTSAAPTVFAPRDSRGQRLSGKVLEAAVCMSGGMEEENLNKHFKDQELEAAHSRFRDGISLNELFLVAAQANGYNSPGQRMNIDVQRAAMGMTGPQTQIRAAGFSTVSLPNVLSNVANKFLREGWDHVDQEWRKISAIRSVSDFKQITTVSLTGDFEFEQVGKNGELKHAEPGELTYNNQADTYGRMCAITRTDFINDDLGALTAIPRRLGRGGALKMNNIFWTAFLNNSSFFASGNSNVSTDTGALGLTGLQQAETIFMNQTDPDGEPLGAEPKILLVPTALKATALELMTSERVVTGSDLTRGDRNIYRGRFDVVSSPYLSNSNYTGYSASAWYLLASPMDIPVIEVAALFGRVEPTVETADAAFNVLGVQMRGYSDVGVALQEYRGGVRADGSAAD